MQKKPTRYNTPDRKGKTARKLLETSYKKYELISSHTARYTGITLSMKKGLLPEEVMQISGHTDRRNFDKYVKITRQESIEKFKRVWDE